MLCVFMCQALAHHHTWCHQLHFSGGTTPSSCTCLTPVEYNKLAAAVYCILSCCALSWHLPKTLSASRLVHGCMHGGHMFILLLGTCADVVAAMQAGRCNQLIQWWVYIWAVLCGASFDGCAVHLGKIPLWRCVQMGLFQGCD
jgi:hypothetical protein